MTLVFCMPGYLTSIYNYANIYTRNKFKTEYMKKLIFGFAAIVAIMTTSCSRPCPQGYVVDQNGNCMNPCGPGFSPHPQTGACVATNTAPTNTNPGGWGAWQPNIGYAYKSKPYFIGHDNQGLHYAILTVCTQQGFAYVVVTGQAEIAGLSLDLNHNATYRISYASFGVMPVLYNGPQVSLNPGTPIFLFTGKSYVPGVLGTPCG